MKKLIVLLLSTTIFVTSFYANADSSDSSNFTDNYKTATSEIAIDELSTLASQGDAESQYLLARMYDNGEGVPQNYKEAAQEYSIVALACKKCKSVKRRLLF